MKIPAIISIILHCLVLLLISINFNSPFKEINKDTNTFVVDFVKIDTKTKAPTLSPQPKQEQEPSKQLLEKAQAEPKPTNNQESLVEKKAPPSKQEQKKEEPKPDLKEKTLPKNENVVLLKKKEEKKPPEKKEEKKKDLSKPLPKTQDKQKKAQNKGPEKAVINLKKDKNKKPMEEKPKKQKVALEDLLKDAMQDDNSGEDGNSAHEVGDVITASQIDAIRQTIRKCWYIPAGLKNMKDIVVDIQMEIAEDGTVKKASIINKEKANTDSDFRTASEAAQRAVLDPACNPLPLPRQSYNEWKDLEISFNPKDMF